MAYATRRIMRRWLVIAVMLVAAVQPVLHSHSLFSDSNSCPACTVTASCAVEAPSVAAPLTVAYTLTVSPERTIFVAVARTFSPRAPPLAA